MAKRKPRRVIEAFGSKGWIVARGYVRASNDIEAQIALKNDPKLERVRAYTDAGFPYVIRTI